MRYVRERQVECSSVPPPQVFGDLLGKLLSPVRRRGVGIGRVEDDFFRFFPHVRRDSG